MGAGMAGMGGAMPPMLPGMAPAAAMPAPEKYPGSMPAMAMPPAADYSSSKQMAYDPDMAFKMNQLQQTMDMLVQRQEAQNNAQLQMMFKQEAAIGQRVEQVVSQSLNHHIHDSLRSYMPTFEADAFAALERATIS